MMRPAPTRRAKPSEEGYILVMVMFMLALLIIAMAVALPKMSASIQRDRDLETWHRGMQYRRAIQLYYRKFNRYPPNLDALVKTNEIRFLRKKYIDPTTRKDEWKPIMFGQNKTPLAMGFFGQPLGGIGMGGLMAGIGPAGGNGIAGANPVGGALGGRMGSQIGGAMGSINPNGGMGTPGTAGGTITGTTTGTTTTGTTDANGNPTDPSQGGTQLGGNTAFGGATFGGGAIIGVSPMSPKESILVYKKKNHYNEWEFLYSPLSEQGMMPVNQNSIQPSQPGVGAPGTIFSPGGGAGSGGLSPSPTPTPMPTPTPAPNSPQ
jgi:type II secretory pathway pseudopilin PulG